MACIQSMGWRESNEVGVSLTESRVHRRPWALATFLLPNLRGAHEKVVFPEMARAVAAEGGRCSTWQEGGPYVEGGIQVKTHWRKESGGQLPIPLPSFTWLSCWFPHVQNQAAEQWWCWAERAPNPGPRTQRMGTGGQDREGTMGVKVLNSTGDGSYDFFRMVDLAGCAYCFPTLHFPKHVLWHVGLPLPCLLPHPCFAFQSLASFDPSVSSLPWDPFVTREDWSTILCALFVQSCILIQ